MKIYGFMGRTGAGKSTAVNYLSDFGFSVIDADKIGHNIYKKGKKAYFEILDFFGNDILDKDEEIDRKKLGKIVFSNPKKLKKLNEITHPLIYNEIEEKIQDFKLQNKENVILDAALLYEAGLTSFCDEVIYFCSDSDLLCKRIMTRDSLSETDAKNRIASRKSDDELKKHADFIIENNGSLSDFLLKIKKHFNLI